MGFYKTHRAYLVAAIHGEQRIVKSEWAHKDLKAHARSILRRHCAELDDLDATAAEKSREGVIA